MWTFDVNRAALTHVACSTEHIPNPEAGLLLGDFFVRY